MSLLLIQVSGSWTFIKCMISRSIEVGKKEYPQSPIVINYERRKRQIYESAWQISHRNNVCYSSVYTTFLLRKGLKTANEINAFFENSKIHALEVCLSVCHCDTLRCQFINHTVIYENLGKQADTFIRWNGYVACKTLGLLAKISIFTSLPEFSVRSLSQTDMHSYSSYRYISTKLSTFTQIHSIASFTNSDVPSFSEEECIYICSIHSYLTYFALFNVVDSLHQIRRRQWQNSVWSFNVCQQQTFE